MNEPTNKRLIIDLQKCDQCAECRVSCDYYNRPQANDHGMLGLREKAGFLLICRRCEHASCVDVCPFNAIERQDDGVIKRYNLRCVSCKSCAHACPFGTIYPELLPFYETQCDACLGLSDTAPSCVASCSQGALEYRVPDPAETDIHLLDQHLAARATKWIKREQGEEVTAWAAV